MGGKCVVVAVLRGQVLTASLAMPAELSGVSRSLHIGHVEATVSPCEPGIAEIVIDNGEGLFSEARIDVVRPQRPTLVQVLVRVDDGRHGGLLRGQYGRSLTMMSWAGGGNGTTCRHVAVRAATKYPDDWFVGLGWVSGSECAHVERPGSLGVRCWRHSDGPGETNGVT